MIKPKQLQKGDKVALLSPSGGLAGMLPHRVENGIKNLENMGYEVVLMQNAKNVQGYTAGTPEERAEDIHSAFKDQNIKAIIAFIGGFHANQLLKHLDFELIRNNPKIFMGFSDISVLHFAFYTQAGLTTFYGPAVLTQFAEPFGIDTYTLEYFNKAVTSGSPIGKVEPSKEWTDELLNWFQKADLERPRNMKNNDGYSWLKEGNASGKIVGGCITSILHLRGTKYWPNLDNSIFFWELPESSSDLTKGEPISRIDAHLTDLELSGVFDQINGMLVGRPKGYSEEDVDALKKVIIERTKDYNFPILFNIDTGHTDPIMTIPLGVDCHIDSQQSLFEITECATM